MNLRPRHLFFLLLLLLPALRSYGQDVPLIPIESDNPVIENLREEGWYGRVLEVQGKNQEALEYYLQADTADSSKNRAELLKWYLGLGDIPQSILDSHRTAMLAEYYSSPDMEISDLKSEIPGSFEVEAAKAGNLFILPFLFHRTGAVSESTPEPAEADHREDTQAGDDLEQLPDNEVLIQLGSFREENNAHSHLAHLKEKGIEAELKVKEFDGDTFYITVIEPGIDIQQTLLRLKEKGVEGFPLYP